jgi:hypothetical protein
MMTGTIVRSFVCATVIFTATASSATDFYVDSFAKFGGSGSSVSPFQTIQEGVNKLGPGDTLHIRGDILGPGRIYSETPTFRVSGKNNTPITIQGFPGEKVVIATPEMIRLDRDFLVIKNLIFDHQGAAHDAVRWSGDSIDLTECEIRNGARDAIDISGKARRVSISNCVIYNFVWDGSVRRDAHCIVVNPGARSIRITGNKIYDCSGDGIQIFASDSTPVSSYVTEVLIENNQIYSTGGAKSENALDLKGGVAVIIRKNEIYGFTHNKAVVVQKGASNVRLEENRIHDSERGAEFRSEGGHAQQDITVTRNVFFNIAGQYALKFDGVLNARVVNNTFHNIAGDSIRVESKGINGGDIKNNLIHLSRGPRISGTFVADYSHNGWFKSSAGKLESFSDTVGNDPLFVNAANADFRLILGGPAVDKGIAVGLLYRGSAPDLGAFEMDGVLPNSILHRIK